LRSARDSEIIIKDEWDVITAGIAAVNDRRKRSP